MGAADRSRSPRRTLLVILALAVLSTLGSVVAVIVLAGGGVSQIEATPVLEAQGRVVVRFSNRGTRAGYLCGWVTLRCADSEKQTVHLCAEDVQPGAPRIVATKLRTGGRARCAVSFLRDDVVET